MSAQVIVGKAVYTIPGADHLRVDGDLVQIQRSSPSGYETVAVAGEELLVTIEPATCTRVLVRSPGEQAGPREPAAPTPPLPAGLRSASLWYPVGDLMEPAD